MSQRAAVRRSYSHMRAAWVALGVLLASWLGSRLNAEAANDHLATVTSARVAHQLTPSEASKGYPIRLRAVVTYYDPSPDPRHSVLFVTDETASIYVALAATPASAVGIGDLVEVTGTSGPGEFAPAVGKAEVRRIGAWHLPAVAPRVSMEDLLAGKEDSQWVEIEGVVHAVHTVGRHVYLDMTLRDGDITAMTVQSDKGNYSALIDATVVLRGNAGTVFNQQRQMTGAHFLFPGPEMLRVIEPAPAEPFAQAAQPVGELLHFSAVTGLRHRVHVQGTVTLQWPGRLLCIEDQGRGMCAQIDQTDTVARGDRVDLVGFPEIGAFTPTLLHATYRPAGGREPVAAVDVTASQALQGGEDSKLVSIQARLIGHDQSATEPTLILSAGNSVLSAVLPRGYLAEGLALQEGSVVQVTGICSIQADGSQRDGISGFPVPTSIRILLESPGDIAIRERPSWWNAKHSLWILTLALFAALAGLFRVMILGRRVKLQTLTIRDSEARFRHLATHDGLTEVPNRASIMTSLEMAIEHAGRVGTSVCIALIDLDHFKRINDTLGHLAGDEVLRQSVRRLASAIRSTDVIGRYGGEEFLIVFNDMELEHGIARCELVRQALCDSPIRWGEQELTITCSIGVAAARMAQSPIPLLVSNADHAMYVAKTQGRNRVVSAGALVTDDSDCLVGRR